MPWETEEARAVEGILKKPPEGARHKHAQHIGLGLVLGVRGKPAGKYLPAVFKHAL
jgi:hypothetical protein